MESYSGGCHCGHVRFEIQTDLATAVECNCSVCRKKGALHHRVPPERFNILSGHDALDLYQFGSREAKHWFCKHCGIHSFSNPRAAPDMYSVNIRCLDDYEALKADIKITQFDGKHWEEAVKTFRF